MTAQVLAGVGEARLSAFRAAARAARMDPDDPWVGGYVDYEWTHLRPVLDVYGIDPAGKKVLEFGSNVGASGIVLAKLGAQVTGVDVDPAFVAVANANIALNGVESGARALHVPDTRAMPLDSDAFDLVIANSVLEYVPSALLVEVMTEIHRVMKPRGRMLVLGTASRIALREIHSHRWLVNYLPRFVDGIVGKDLQRGLSPFLLKRAIAGRFDVECKGEWLAAREAVHGSPGLPIRAVALAAGALDMAPGWLSPNIELMLRKV